jgi:hypothetical protein
MCCQAARRIFGAGLVIAFEELEQLASDDAPEAPLGLAPALALGGAAGHVGASVGIGRRRTSRMV